MLLYLNIISIISITVYKTYMANDGCKKNVTLRELLL
jgi:hypothetical protein